MNAGPEADGLYLDRIVEVVTLIRHALDSVSEPQFLGNRTLGDATALRLGAIGEISRKLSPDLKARNPNVPWERMYKLRNIVAHHYDQLDYRIIWEVATTALDALLAACRAELDRIDGSA
jgi:uncharacterized protein with HEPN domain